MDFGGVMRLVRYYFIEMFLAPINEGREDWHQGAACFRQRILYPWWHLWKNFTMHQMALLQTLQCLGKHLLGTVRHETAHLVETQHTRLAPVQQKQNKQRPLVAKTADDLPDGTG